MQKEILEKLLQRHIISHLGWFQKDRIRPPPYKNLWIITILTSSILFMEVPISSAPWFPNPSDYQTFYLNILNISYTYNRGFDWFFILFKKLWSVLIMLFVSGCVWCSIGYSANRWWKISLERFEDGRMQTSRLGERQRYHCFGFWYQQDFCFCWLDFHGTVPELLSKHYQDSEVCHLQSSQR